MKRWVIAIVCLLGVNVLATVALAVVANNGDTQIIPGYYDRAVHYNDAIARAAHDRELGWRVVVTAGDGNVEVVVRDAAGLAISDASVSVTGYARARAQQVIAVELASMGQGRYIGRGAVTRAGWHDFAIVIARGHDRFDRRVSVEAR